MGGGYTYASGTSIAAPFVTGAAALLQAVAQVRAGGMWCGLLWLSKIHGGQGRCRFPSVCCTQQLHSATPQLITAASIAR